MKGRSADHLTVEDLSVSNSHQKTTAMILGDESRINARLYCHRGTHLHLFIHDARLLSMFLQNLSRRMNSVVVESILKVSEN